MPHQATQFPLQSVPSFQVNSLIINYVVNSYTVIYSLRQASYGFHCTDWQGILLLSMYTVCPTHLSFLSSSMSSDFLACTLWNGMFSILSLILIPSNVCNLWCAVCSHFVYMTVKSLLSFPWSSIDVKSDWYDLAFTCRLVFCFFV